MKNINNYCNKKMANDKINFDFVSLFGDLIRFVCVFSHKRVNDFYYNAYMYINNVYKKTYNNIHAVSYSDLKQQISIIYNNF